MKSFVLFFLIFFITHIVIDIVIELAFDTKITNELLTEAILNSFLKAIFFSVLWLILDYFTEFRIKRGGGSSFGEIEAKLKLMNFRPVNNSGDVREFEWEKMKFLSKYFRIFLAKDGADALLIGRRSLLKMIRDFLKKQ